MVRIVLVMHAPLGTAFAACAEHVFQKKPDLTVFDVPAGAAPDKLAQQLSQQLLAQPDKAVLMLCDLYGATPFNIARQALKTLHENDIIAHLITGANLCMLLKALNDQHEDPLTLRENVRQRGIRGIVHADNNF
ncbi:MAG TPA: PTS sugar transporter subunit IIA [Burkholderiaceae bacterium]|nr:PTS sugar transporter subunit IIA [Burkholderiaceae bacterium]